MRGKRLAVPLFCILVVLGLAIVVVPAQDSELITKVQSALKEKGYNPGPADGIMGPRTSNALRDFQIKNDIPVSGEIDKPTLDRLGIKGSFMGKVGSGFKTVAGATTKGAKATASATTTGAKATAKGATKGAKATASGATTGAKATAPGATTGAKATSKGATTGAKATASGASKGAKATASGATTGAKATASGASKGGKAVASGATKGAKAATGWLPGKKGGDLASRVKARLKKDLNLTAEQVSVRTEGNNVYLLFSGGTKAEWNRAVATARKVDGVENVFIRLP